MDVKTKNELFLRGNLEARGLFPALDALSDMTVKFSPHFGLDNLPTEPGLIMVRGARQLGKSTWLEMCLQRSLKEFGPGSAFYLNGDDILSNELLKAQMELLVSAFAQGQKICRIFIDEITAIDNWELAIKRLWDEGTTRKCLIITTGSKAVDLRRGTERLPGRKGRLDRSNYIFTPISYSQFISKCSPIIKKDHLWIYILTGGSPIAINEYLKHKLIPNYVIELTRDWIFGECAGQKRSKSLLKHVIDTMFIKAGTPIALSKLARDSGVANNTVLSGYLDLLKDLMCVSMGQQIDGNTFRPIPRKAHKFHFINLLAAGAFYPSKLRTAMDFQLIDPTEQAKWIEWCVASELWRRMAIDNLDDLDILPFWKSRHNKIDFLTKDRLIEVKSGPAGPFDFSWFKKQFPKKRLTVITTTPFETDAVKGVTIEDFLAESK